MQPPKIIITDLHIRGIDGLMFVRAIRKDPKFNDVPIVALTSDFSDDSRRAAFQAGVQEYIVKGTIGRDSLIERIKRLIDPPTPL